MRLSYKKPAKCVKELHSPEQQHANTHRLFVKLCWLMDEHAVSADRVVNIDETSCRLLMVQQIGWAAAASNRPSCRATPRRPRHSRSPSHGPWPAGHAGADRARGQDRRRLAGAALAGAHSPRNVRERLGHHDDAPAARGHIGQRDEPEQRRTGVDPSLGHGQHPRQRGHPGRHAGRFPTRRAVLHPATKHVVLATLRRGRLPQLQELHPGASERHSCPLRHRRLVRRLGHEQGMAAPVIGRMGGSRSHGPLRQEQGVDNWRITCAHAATPSTRPSQRPTSCTPLASCSPEHIELEPAPAHPVDWAMAEASDDEDDAPMPDSPLEPELIYMPLALASAPPMSSLERCIALRLLSLYKNAQPPSSQIVSLLSHVSVVSCVLATHLCFHVQPHQWPGSQTVTDKKASFFEGSSIVAVAKHGPGSLT